MKNYDFHHLLEPVEFQEFARDMIQVREKIRLEAFREGPDQGMDARCITPDGKCIVMQAKRWANESALRWKELREEKKKADRIKPDRYILVLSRDVSPEQKKKIRELFHPYIIADEDIVTGKDLNGYLGSNDVGYAQAEEKYYKLWIQNTDVLKRTIRDAVNGELLAESRLEWEKAKQNAEVFVETAVYEEARRLLAGNRAIIISGEPGIGKTTLANQLAIFWLSRKGFDTYLWAESVGDLYKAQDMPGKKVVVYDDFWGSNFLNAYGTGKEERRLARLIETVRTRTDFILIMKTREYVLEQGMRQNEELRSLLERHKLECRLKAYSNTEMVRIYLGHLRKAPLTWEQMKELYKIHDQAVLSSYYNPRIIQMYLNSVRPEDEPKECAYRLLQYLRQPEDFWEQIFQNLSDEARIFFMLMDLMPLPVNLTDAHKCYQAAVAGEKEGSLYREFERVIAELEKTVICTETVPEAGNALRVRFQNPSAKDFIHQYISRNFAQYRDMLLRGSCYFECCSSLLELSIKADNDMEYYRRVMERAVSLEDRCFFEYEREYYSYYELLQGYREIWGEPFRDWFAEKFRKLLDDVETASEDMSTEDLKEFPKAAGRAIERRIYEGKEEVIVLYLKAMMKNGLPFQLGDLPVSLKEAGSIYAAAHREELTGYLEWYYRREMCLAAVQNNVFYFEELLYEIEKSQEEMAITFSGELTEKENKYSSWLDEDKIEWEEESEEDEEEEYRYEETVEEFRKSMEDIDRADWKAVREYIRYGNVDKDTKLRLMEIGHRKEPWYWADFLKTESGAVLLMNIVEEKGRLADNLKDALMDIVSYLAGKTGITEMEFTFFVKSLRPVVKKGSVILSEIELEEKAERYFAGREKETVRTLCGCGFLRKWNQWYCVVNPGLFLVSELYFYAIGTEAEKKCLCQLWFDDPNSKFYDWQFAYRGQEALEGLLELDREAMVSYALKPLAQKYCERMETAEGVDAWKKIPVSLEIKCDVSSQGEVLGGRHNTSVLWELLDAAGEGGILDILPESFTAGQLERMKSEGCLEETEYRHETYWVADVAKAGAEILEECGIAERVRELWKKIKSYGG